MNVNRQTLFNILITIALIVTLCGGAGLALMNNGRGSNPASAAPTVSIVDAAYTKAAQINGQQTATSVVNNALFAGGPSATPTLEPHEVIETNIAATFAAQTGVPTLVFTPTPTATKLQQPTVTLVFTPMAQPTATVVVASDERTVYDTVVSACASGAPQVTVGMVTIMCNQKVLPAPADFTDAPAEAANVSLNNTAPNKCMTNAELTAAHGWNSNGVKPVKNGENVPWEGCGKWQMQAVGVGVYWQPFLADFEYTVTQANGVVSVNKGPAKGMYVYGATIRQLDTYTTKDQAWVHDDLTLMAREYNYGFRQDPKYGTVPGVNLDLSGQWDQPDLDSTCPISRAMAVAILGGDDYQNWHWPDVEGGAWVFNSKGDGFHHLNHPGGDGYFDVWVAGVGAVSVYKSDPHNYLGTLNFEEASYHCAP